MQDRHGRASILISYPLPEEAIRLARSRADVDLHTGRDPMTRQELLARLKGCQGLVALITEIVDEALLAACPDLKVVANVAVGYNNVDVSAATRRGVVITNTPD